MRAKANDVALGIGGQRELALSGTSTGPLMHLLAEPFELGLGFQEPLHTLANQEIVLGEHQP